MRLIDIDKTFIEYNTNQEYRANIAGLVNAINDSPTVDAVEVVRCGECVHQAYYLDKDYVFCKRVKIYPEHLMRKCDFCSYGERKEP